MKDTTKGFCCVAAILAAYFSVMGILVKESRRQPKLRNRHSEEAQKAIDKINDSLERYYCKQNSEFRQVLIDEMLSDFDFETEERD